MRRTLLEARPRPADRCAKVRGCRHTADRLVIMCMQAATHVIGHLNLKQGEIATLAADISRQRRSPHTAEVSRQICPQETGQVASAHLQRHPTAPRGWRSSLTFPRHRALFPAKPYPSHSHPVYRCFASRRREAARFWYRLLFCGVNPTKRYPEQDARMSFRAKRQTKPGGKAAWYGCPSGEGQL